MPFSQNNITYNAHSSTHVHGMTDALTSLDTTEVKLRFMVLFFGGFSLVIPLICSDFAYIDGSFCKSTRAYHICESTSGGLSSPSLIFHSIETSQELQQIPSSS
jgi:hypothetical protein